MSYTDEQIVKAYGALLDSLNTDSKQVLIERLTASLQVGKDKDESAFYASFGSFVSQKSAEEIIIDTKAQRQFRAKDIRL